MKKLLIFCFLFSFVSFSFVMWINYNFSSNGLWWGTIYWSDWSYSMISNNWLWTYKINTYNYSYNNAYEDIYNDYTKKSNEIMNRNKDVYVPLNFPNIENLKTINPTNINYSQRLYEWSLQCAEDLKYLLNSVESVCKNSKKLWDLSNCRDSISIALSAFLRSMNADYAWKACNDAWRDWIYILDDLSKIYFWWSTSAAWCPNNSSLENDWICYCDEWYINNDTNDGCMLDVYECGENSYFNWSNCSCDEWFVINSLNNWCATMEDYCHGEYWDKMSVIDDEEWNSICMCEEGYYFYENTNSCKDHGLYCKRKFWRHTESIKDWDLLNCMCEDWYNMVDNVCVKTDEKLNWVKYLPKKSNRTITTIAIYIDDLIDDAYEEGTDSGIEVINYRNDFIKILEKFLNKDLSKAQSKKEFVRVLWKLMPMIK